MEMAGCEVAGALFAISRIQAEQGVQATALMAELRKSSYAAVQMRDVHPMAHSGDGQTSFDVFVEGRRADGRTLQARFKWQAVGTEIYQIAAYADRLGNEQTEPLTQEARLK
jgi:hypothetical protein